MVAAENYALSNECVPNNEVLRISTYHFAIRGKHVNIQRERERQGDVAHGNTRSRAQLGDRRMWLPRHVPRINCFAMIAVFVYTLEASNCTLPVYRECGSNVKCICLIKGVSYAIKLCA